MDGVFLGHKRSTTSTNVTDKGDEIVEETIASIDKFVVMEEIFYDLEGNIDHNKIDSIMVKNLEFVGLFRYRPTSVTRPSIRDYALLNSLSNPFTAITNPAILGLFTSSTKDGTFNQSYCFYTLDTESEIAKVKARVTNLCPQVPNFDYETGHSKESRQYFEIVLKETKAKLSRLDVIINN